MYITYFAFKIPLNVVVKWLHFIRKNPKLVIKLIENKYQ